MKPLLLEVDIRRDRFVEVEDVREIIVEIHGLGHPSRRVMKMNHVQPRIEGVLLQDPDQSQVDACAARDFAATRMKIPTNR